MGTLYALLAAVTWWIDYAVTEKSLTKISISGLLVIEHSIGLTFLLIYMVFFGDFKADISALLSDRKTLALGAFTGTTFAVGSLLICASIKESNATIASLIEITYPIFTILASLLIFRVIHVNPGIITWGFCIFIGVILIQKYG